MKKIILIIIIFIFTFILNGCGEGYVGDSQDCKDNGGIYRIDTGCIYFEEKTLTYSEISEKVVHWKMLLEFHEIAWDYSENIIDENRYLILEPQVIKFISILEGIEEAILDYGDGDDFHLLETSYINELYIMLQNNYVSFINIVKENSIILEVK